jgi:hypothetical protein
MAALCQIFRRMGRNKIDVRGKSPYGRGQQMVPLVRLWIWISAFASLAGWTLSALGQLNRAGYALALAAFAVFIFLQRKSLAGGTGKFSRGRKFLRRFRRPWPLAFAALAVLIFLGGALYPPGNYTGMTYRVARVLQWLAHGHWLWIHTPVYRMNDRACGIEWLSAPILLFTHSLRGLFLVNFLPFLLLPGLIFSVCTRLGVRARVAWYWMWLLPTGYNFILQAGGTANDTFPAVYALASVDFALRAWRSRRPSDLWHSILAAALLTGAKAGNLPLLLPWAIVAFPLAPLLRKKFAATVLVVLMAAAVSLLPNAIWNVHYCGDWSGANLEPAVMTVKNPVTAMTGNVFVLLLNNFAPPLFPLAGWWNAHAPLFMPHFLVSVSEHFDTGFFWLGEVPTEDWAGIGFGLGVLLVVSVLASSRIRGTKPTALIHPPLPPMLCHLALVAAWISLFVYCLKAGMPNAARIIAPYYPLLLPLLLIGAGQSQIVRRTWWHVLAGIAVILAFIALALSPDRPLWPAKTVLAKLAAQHPDSHSLSRALAVYTVYSQRSDLLANVRALLPPDVKTVGFIGDPDDCDVSLWLPLGTRRVEHFLLSDPPKLIRDEGVEYVVVGGFNLRSSGLTLDAWRDKSGADFVAGTNATEKVSEGPQPWYLVRFKP